MSSKVVLRSLVVHETLFFYMWPWNMWNLTHFHELINWDWVSPCCGLYYIHYPHHGLKLCEYCTLYCYSRLSCGLLSGGGGRGVVTNWLVSRVWRRLGNLRLPDRRTDRYVSYVYTVRNVTGGLAAQRFVWNSCRDIRFEWKEPNPVWFLSCWNCEWCAKIFFSRMLHWFL